MKTIVTFLVERMARKSVQLCWYVCIVHEIWVTQHEMRWLYNCTLTDALFYFVILLLFRPLLLLLLLLPPRSVCPNVWQMEVLHVENMMGAEVL